MSRKSTTCSLCNQKLGREKSWHSICLERYQKNLNSPKRQKEIADVTASLDKLCGAETSQVALDIYSFQNAHGKRFLKEYGRFVQQFECAYDLLAKITHAVNYIDRKDWPKHRSLQFLLIIHNLKSLFSAFDRLVSGFYEDSFVLTRPVYEAFIRIIFINCHPDRAAAGILEQRDGAKEFNLTNFLSDELKLDRWKSYRLFSMYIHSNSPTILQDWVRLHSKKQPEPVCLKFSWDKNKVEACINHIVFLALVYLKMCVDLLCTSYNHALTKKMLIKANKLINLLSKGMMHNPKPHWPQIWKDTQDLFQLLSNTETFSNTDWKVLWNKIRSQ